MGQAQHWKEYEISNSIVRDRTEYFSLSLENFIYIFEKIRNNFLMVSDIQMMKNLIQNLFYYCENSEIRKSQMQGNKGMNT